MTLKELGGLFKSYPVVVPTFHGEEVSLDQFRKLTVQNLRQAGNFVGGYEYSRFSLYTAISDNFSPLSSN